MHFTRHLARGRLLAVLILTTACIHFVCGCSPAPASPPHPEAASFLAQFERKRPGFGVVQSTGESTHDPMAYGLYASCASRIGLIEDARIAADWLVANTSSATRPGWGQPHAWDAFGDGSINPRSAVYAISTAINVRGLLDTYDQTGEQKYLNASKHALDFYSDFFIETEQGGFFAYSDQPTDQIEVHNANAALMGQYARMHSYFPEDGFDELAHKAMKQLDFRAKTYGDGRYWNYHVQVDRPNDLIHACHLIQGRLEYRRHLDSERDLAPDLDYLNRFRDASLIRRFADHHNLSDRQANMAASPDAIGVLAFVHANADDIDSWRIAMSHLEPLVHAVNGESAPHDPENFHPRKAGLTALGLCVSGSR